MTLKIKLNICEENELNNPHFSQENGCKKFKKSFN